MEFNSIIAATVALLFVGLMITSLWIVVRLFENRRRKLAIRAAKNPTFSPLMNTFADANEFAKCMHRLFDDLQTQGLQAYYSTAASYDAFLYSLTEKYDAEIVLLGQYDGGLSGSMHSFTSAKIGGGGILNTESFLIPGIPGAEHPARAYFFVQYSYEKEEWYEDLPGNSLTYAGQDLLNCPPGNRKEVYFRKIRNILMFHPKSDPVKPKIIKELLDSCKVTSKKPEELPFRFYNLVVYGNDRNPSHSLAQWSASSYDKLPVIGKPNIFYENPIVKGLNLNEDKTEMKVIQRIMEGALLHGMNVGVTGPTGTGKTYLCFSILRNLAKMGAKCVFLQPGQLKTLVSISQDPTSVFDPEHLHVLYLPQAEEEMEKTSMMNNFLSGLIRKQLNLVLLLDFHDTDAGVKHDSSLFRPGKLMTVTLRELTKDKADRLIIEVTRPSSPLYIGPDKTFDVSGFEEYMKTAETIPISKMLEEFAAPSIFRPDFLKNLLERERREETNEAENSKVVSIGPTVQQEAKVVDIRNEDTPVAPPEYRMEVPPLPGKEEAKPKKPGGRRFRVKKDKPED